MEMITAYVGLGANLGDPVQQIIDARKQLSSDGAVSDVRCSSLYVSSPVGYSDQPDFVNSVMSLQTTHDALSLLRVMQAIETRIGRVRDAHNQNAARLIDLDLLLFANQKIDTPILRVPHPRLSERLFVLLPLQELDATLVVDQRGTVSQIIDAGKTANLFGTQRIQRLG